MTDFDFVEQIVEDWMMKVEFGQFSSQDGGNSSTKGKKKRKSPNADSNMGNAGDCCWGRMLKNPAIQDPTSRAGKLFRRRFRIPFPIFQKLLDIAREKRLFGHADENCTGQPAFSIELKLLGVLRILGRGWCFDDVAEGTNMSEETVRRSFLAFCTNFVKSEYDSYVKPPEGEKLQSTMKVYEAMGLPGCVGSVDCVHIKWDRS
jgi:hypothetical protein